MKHLIEVGEFEEVIIQTETHPIKLGNNEKYENGKSYPHETVPKTVKIYFRNYKPNGEYSIDCFFANTASILKIADEINKLKETPHVDDVYFHYANF